MVPRKRGNRRPTVAAALLLLALSAWPRPGAAGGADRIITFWRADCAPCLVELQTLPKIAAAHPDLQITLLVLQDDGRGAAALERDPNENLVLEAFDGDPEALFARYGNEKRALPYSVALTAEGTVCASHYGLLGTALVAAWVVSC